MSEFREITDDKASLMAISEILTYIIVVRNGCYANWQAIASCLLILFPQSSGSRSTMVPMASSLRNTSPWDMKSRPLLTESENNFPKL